MFDKVAGQSLNSYFGLAFEKLCMKNLQNIFKNIGYDIYQIIGFGPFFRQRKRNESHDEGLQIDILVHKKGQGLTLIECKYSTTPISTSIIPEIERKIKFLKAPRHFTIERILISGGEVTANLQKSDYFHHIVGMETLF